MFPSHTKTVAIIVAHPDDETLWAGGTLLHHPSWQCFIVCLCRKSDKERSDKFYQALKALKSEGIMGDLDDSPEQTPLSEMTVEQVVLELLPTRHFDLIITHSPIGEYTRHLRHEETSRAVITLWQEGKISADQLWTFAYEDGNEKYYPKPIENASIYQVLDEQIWLEKYSIITNIYGFKIDSWEAITTPLSESFWEFTNSKVAKDRLEIVLSK
jgi:LmbE family N-acetylglucosaminyl deacetylase